MPHYLHQIVLLGVYGSACKIQLAKIFREEISSERPTPRLRKTSAAAVASWLAHALAVRVNALKTKRFLQYSRHSTKQTCFKNKSSSWSVKNFTVLKLQDLEAADSFSLSGTPCKITCTFQPAAELGKFDVQEKHAQIIRADWSGFCPHSTVTSFGLLASLRAWRDDLPWTKEHQWEKNPNQSSNSAIVIVGKPKRCTAWILDTSCNMKCRLSAHYQNQTVLHYRWIANLKAAKSLSSHLSSNV